MVSERYIIQDFDRNSLETFYYGNHQTARTTVWSPTELLYLGKTSPLTVMHINQEAGTNFPVSQDGLQEQAKALAAYITMTTDNSIFKGVLVPRMVKSKVRNTAKLHELLRHPFQFDENLVTEDNFLDHAYSAKMHALAATINFPNKQYPKTSVRRAQTPHFALELERLLGDNLVQIVQYGSSTTGNGKDIDLMVFVERYTRQIYSQIWNMQASIKSPKPIGIVLIPTGCISGYAECDYHSREVADTGQLIYGPDLKIPVLSEAVSVMKMYFKSGKELTSLRGSLGDFSRQEGMSQSSNFLRETLKLEIWIKKALRQIEEERILTKAEFLAIEPVHIPDFTEETTPISIVRELLFDANYRLKMRIEEHFMRMMP